MAGLWFEKARLNTGWARAVRIEIADGRIRTVEPDVLAQPADERHAIGLPGLANLHSHAFQRAMAGRAERRGASADSFWSWRTAMYGLAAALEPDAMQAIAALAFAEMLEAGFTRVGEFHYLHKDLDGSAYADPAEMSARLAAAAETTGIGLTLLPVFYAHSGFGGAPPTEGQRRFVHDLDGFARLLDGARRALRALPDGGLGVAPHSLRAVTQAELEDLLKIAPAGPVHLHIAEQGKEVADCLAWCGERPVEWLFNRFAVDARWCLVHATHVTSRELEAIARSGAVVGLCPITEANLGDGLFPAAALLGLGGRFGVGSDSNVLIDPAEELRLLEYGQRLTTHHRNALAAPGGRTGERLFDEALRGGAQALSVAPDAIAPGAPATFISLDADHAAFAESPAEEVLDRWLFAARAPAVDCVWRWGRKVVAGGRHLQRRALVAAFRSALQRFGA